MITVTQQRTAVRPANEQRTRPQAHTTRQRTFINSRPRGAVPQGLMTRHYNVSQHVNLRMFVPLTGRTRRLLGTSRLLRRDVIINNRITRTRRLSGARLMTAFRTMVRRQRRLVRILPTRQRRISLSLRPNNHDLLRTVGRHHRVTATHGTTGHINIRHVRKGISTTSPNVSRRQRFFYRRLAVNNRTSILGTRLTSNNRRHFRFKASRQLATDCTRTLSTDNFSRVHSTTHRNLNQRLVLHDRRPLTIKRTMNANMITN